MKPKTILQTCLFTFCFSYLNAQSIQRQTLSSAGNTLEKNQLYLSQSIGQPSLVGNGINQTTIVRQGFQQPIDISGFSQESIEIVIYPNPSHLVCYYKTNLPRNSQFKMTLLDASGRKIVEQSVHNEIENSLELPKEIQGGLYHMKIETTHLSGTAKLIIL